MDEYSFLDSQQERPVASKSLPGTKTDAKTHKRKLFSPGGNSEDEGEKRSSTPKRRRSLHAEGSPTPGSTTPKTPTTLSRRTVPLSERQQMAILKQMTEEESKQTTELNVSGDGSPRPISSSPDLQPAFLKKTPADKKVNKRNERGETPLHLAAIRGDVKASKKLILSGADVNVKDYAGWTPLHEACNRGRIDVTRQLLKAGANVNVQGMENDTPLHDAAINGHKKLVELLLRHGAYPLQTNSKGQSALDVAANQDIIKLLKNELIASSSSSSSLDDVRSPTSPESNNESDQDDDKKNEGQESAMSSTGSFSGKIERMSPSAAIASTSSPKALSSLAYITSNAGTTAGLTPLSPTSSIQQQTATTGLHKRTLPSNLTKNTDKLGTSPRLTLIFQPIRKDGPNKEPLPKYHHHNKSPRDAPQYTSYSVTVETTEGYDPGKLNYPGSPGVCESSQDSELCDSQQGLNIGFSGQSNMDKDQKTGISVVSTTTVMSDSRYQCSSDSVEKSGKDNPYETQSDNNSANSSQTTVTSFPQTNPDIHKKISDIDGTSHKITVSHASQLAVTSSSEILKIVVPRRTIMAGKGDAYAPDTTRHSGPYTPASSNTPCYSNAHQSSMTTSETSRSGSKNSQVAVYTFEESDEDDFTIKKEIMPNTAYSKMHRDQHQASPGMDKEDHLPKIERSPKFDSRDTKGKADRDRTLGSRFSECQPSPRADPQLTTVKWEQKENQETPKECKQEMDTQKDQQSDNDNQMSKATETIPKAGHESKVDIKTEVKIESDYGSPIDYKADVSKSENTKLNLRRGDDSALRLESDTKLEVKNEMRFVQDQKGEKEMKFSPKSENEGNVKCDMAEQHDSRSPKSDSGRSMFPKVPPLKIILNSKLPAVPGSDTLNLKALLMKPALPYVLNPTQEGQQAMAAPETGVSGECSQSAVTNLAESTGSVSEILKNTGASEHGSEPTNVSQSPVTTEHVPTSSAASTSSLSSTSSAAGMSLTSDSIARRTRNKEKETEKEKKEDDNEEGEEKSGDRDGKKEDEEKPGERRMTRSVFRTQQQQQEKEKPKTPAPTNSGDSSSEKDQKENSKNEQQEQEHIHPRKRKLRPRAEQAATQQQLQGQQFSVTQHHDKPENPYEMYLSIRKQIEIRRSHWEVVQPKAPQGFKDYLMVKRTYVLEGNAASRLSVPMLSPPNSVTGPLRDLFTEQEKKRYQLRLQHLIEKEKLMLSVEQEILRVHGRAARALANQATPLSFCAILRDENVYYPLEPEQVQHQPLSRRKISRQMQLEDREKNVRSRYNGRQFLSWLQDVDDKFEKIKETLLLRHHHEAESLHAVQKLEWEWKMTEAGLCDHKSNPVVDDICVPMVHVSDDFDLLPA